MCSPCNKKNVLTHTRTHEQVVVWYLWDVVLCRLRGRERHRCHGHHDWLISRVHGCCWRLRARP